MERKNALASKFTELSCLKDLRFFPACWKSFKRDKSIQEKIDPNLLVASNA